jgi:pimeloyl-ACP methyl ester carboxylesterase
MAAGMLLAAPPVQAGDRGIVTVRAPDAPGPARFNRVFVHRFGPASGEKVLVLIPGTNGGAGDFSLTARYLTRHIDGLQVWAIDRRSQALEDTSVFRRAARGQATLQEMFDYYLGWLDGASPPKHFQFLNGEDFPFARRWGMKVALRDVRAVVKKARHGGRRSVVLGGHSLGASLTLAYAAWDFSGRPGYKGLDGLVLIDGGLLGSFDAYDLGQAKQAIADLETQNPFADLLGLGLPEAAGVFAEVGGLYARFAPTQSATTLQVFSLLPDEFNPPFPVTNRALLGYAFDRETSPLDPSLHVNAGGLEAAGDPRDWSDGGVTPVARIAETFGQDPSNSIEWYFPKRLTIDTNGADQLRPNAVARYLGLRLEHTPGVNLPLYALQTDLTDGDVLRGARRFIRRSQTTRAQSRLVNADPRQSHLDPLMGAAPRNLFFKTVAPFLRHKVFPGR